MIVILIYNKNHNKIIRRKTVKKTVYFIYRIQRLPTCLECSFSLIRHTHALLCLSPLLQTVTRLEAETEVENKVGIKVENEVENEVEIEVENEIENEVEWSGVGGSGGGGSEEEEERSEKREEREKDRRGRECGEEEEEGVGEGGYDKKRIQNKTKPPPLLLSFSPRLSTQSNPNPYHYYNLMQKLDYQHLQMRVNIFHLSCASAALLLLHWQL